MSPAGVVQSVRFATATPPPVFRVPDDLQQTEPMIRMAMESMPEGTFLGTMIAVNSVQFGLTTEHRTNTLPALNRVYERIEKDPAFAHVKSALPYCFSTTPNSQGQYFIARPDHVPTNPTTIVFLHGYGGNFLFYVWTLKEEFPDAVILVPSWSASWYNGSMDYLRDMLRDAERRVGTPLTTPWLMAISAGGRGGFRIYNANPNSFTGFICLAAAPDTAIVTNLNPRLRVQMINGTRDDLMPVRIARTQVTRARRRVPGLKLYEFDTDHFFFLTRRTDTFRLIKKFMQQPVVPPSSPPTKPVKHP